MTKTNIDSYQCFQRKRHQNNKEIINRFMKQFSILIPTWNNLPYLKLCIQSIRNNSAFEHQIIIHINEGVDGTLEWVKNEGLEYTYSENNIGVCLSLNMARTKVATDYICFINDDMYMLPNWDVLFYNEIKSLNNSKMFFLSGSVIQPNSMPPEGSGLIKNFGDSIESFNETKLLKEYEGLVVEDWYGATAPPNIVHKDLWDLVGGYSIEFSPGMGSDPDFTCKLIMVGVKYLKGIGKCMAYHFVSKSVGRVKRNKPGEQIIFKWGLPHSTFRKHFIRMGGKWSERYGSNLDENKLYREGIRAKLKGLFYLLKTLFKKEKLYAIPHVKSL